ncbi:MAG TPA: sigma-70 family RNA polymerase sigma factor [Saprospiraceae bacterium]|nr:sigma-70 family RNA polymerase sigma factor [Saprospiraceae bacterium]
MDLNTLISKCKTRDPLSQKHLYERYNSILFGICRRYIANTQEAEDVFVEGFTKIFQKIDQYEGNGSFEGWMKKIMVNEALMFIRSNKIKFEDINIIQIEAKDDFHIESDLEVREILALMDEMPDGYRTIFNLYVVEDYKHQEIADLLGISINTSKSQLIFAKKKMAQLLKKKYNLNNSIKYGT